MNGREYLRFLERSVQGPNFFRTVQDTINRWGRIRAQQMATSTAEEEAIKDSYKLALERRINNETASDRFNSNVARPFLLAMGDEKTSLFKDTAVGVLPLRVVNAHVLKTPAGEPVIAIDQGLMTMSHFYIETQHSVRVLLQAGKTSEAYEHLDKSYRFIVDFFRKGGNVEYPEQVVKITQSDFAIITASTIAVETFALAHEYAHIEAGHISDAEMKQCSLLESRRSNVSVVQHSWKQEQQADLYGWLWYQQSWKSIPALQWMPSILATTAPLFFFSLLALVEKNTSVPDKFSSHPPSIGRFGGLLVAGSIGTGIWNKENRAYAQALMDFALSTPVLD